MVRRTLTWLFIGFLIFFVARRPAAAATVARWIAAVLAGIATGGSDFISNLIH
ncbi:hypothetical protein GCM10023322_25250 [Rugosimonospora acidiphila]|uniref:Uncharacterized protein n=1 Tax=Rugosimonospora acidiphila TaxID=556531 RepID=A0ABP9RS74_9ACTN